MSGTCYCGGFAQLCGNACVNVSSNVAHCGKCDNACPAGQLCSGGKCG